MSIGVKLEPVSDLLNRNFFIRSYQRGYRWDEDQVNDLLNDFREFIDQPYKTEEEFYCLQPIVVKRLSNNEKEKLSRFNFNEEIVYEVIDGQQRITTITIILNYLKERLKDEIKLNSLPSITYEVREKSKEILTNFNHFILLENNEELDNNIDFYHMKIVYNTISEWFSKVEEKYPLLFLKLLTSFKINCVKVIWYEVDEKDNSIEVFRRFNVGKIPLTNSELIKAIFLRDNDNVKNATKFSISKEWQQIENQLQDKYFWSFLSPSKKYPSRIEYIFDLIFLKARNSVKEDKSELELFDKKYGNDKHNVFRYFAYQISNTAKLSSIWDDVNEIYEKLLQWFNNSEHYHYIGYLQNKEGKKSKNIILEVLLNNFQTKNDLTDYLIECIKDETKHFFKDKKIVLNYRSDKRDLRNFFFLANIQSYINLSISSNGEEIYKLPFNRYSSISYDIEHIDSKTEKDVSALSKEEKIEFLKDLELDFSFEIGTNFSNIINDLLIDNTLTDKWFNENVILDKLDSSLESILDLVNEFLEKEPDKLTELEKDNIGNLTILNDFINRGYGNAYFNTKRRLIIDTDKDGVYIPIATKNVFLKYYSGNTKKHSRWSKIDAMNYTTELEKSLLKFMN